MRSIQTRFWNKVDKKGPVHPTLKTRCWIWVGASKRKLGYGNFGLNGKMEGAHRVSWFLTYGSWPKLNVLHHCDNPACVRPDHLFEGTHRDNMNDRVCKGRVPKKYNGGRPTAKAGEGHFMVKLTNEDVLEIRRKHAMKQYKQGDLAAYYGISQGRLSLIVNGKGWKHLLEQPPST